MELIGSLTSPYVRRVRLILENKDYQLTTVNVFSEQGKNTVAEHTTTGRVPLLIDGEHTLWDSYLICEYLEGPYDLETKKSLFLISEIIDSAVQLFQLRKFNVDPEDQGLFSKNNLERIKQTLAYFEQQPLKWDAVGKWLFCVLDWLSFRDVYAWQAECPNLQHFVEQNNVREICQKTAPVG